MSLVYGEQLDDLLLSKDYDVRKSHNARWIDQKCTPDVVAIVADCILEFMLDKPIDTSFTSMDIWHNEYTVQNILDIFKKPSPRDERASNEYDKFFQQPMEMLSYAGILSKIKVGNRNFYFLRDKALLEDISLSERNALRFLVRYITKVLEDSDIYHLFDNFFDNQNSKTYDNLKQGFSSFTKSYTPINGDTEAWRIFIKVINPLAYAKNTAGTERGRLSRDIITYDMLMYNRDNFRDIYQRKPKGITRGTHRPSSTSQLRYNQYLTDKAMKNVKLINQHANNGLSEVGGDVELATETHHIFPKSEFPDIAFFLENLINLTPNQHRNHAHPMGKYSIIDEEYQRICLIAKVNTVRKSISNNWGDYDFNNILYVADRGYGTDVFSKINHLDYDELIHKINLVSRGEK
jgi:hypothetical protein